MTRVCIHSKYLKESSLADWELMILQNPREENSLDHLLPGGENIPSNSVFFLAQYVSFLLNFQLFHIFKFSLVPSHLSDSFYLLPFSLLFLLLFLPFCCPLGCFSLCLPLFFFPSSLSPSHPPESAYRSWGSLSPVAPGGPWLVTNYPMALLFLFCLINL